MSNYKLPKPQKCRYCEDNNVYNEYCYTCNQVQPKPITTNIYTQHISNKYILYGRVTHKRSLDQIDNSEEY